MTEVSSLTGRLLVATPVLADPNFDRAVVLLLDHDEEGSLGVVLNRPTPVDVSDILEPWAALAGEPGVVFQGGPVSLDAALGVAVVPTGGIGRARTAAPGEERAPGEGAPPGEGAGAAAPSVRGTAGPDVAVEACDTGAGEESDGTTERTDPGRDATADATGGDATGDASDARDARDAGNPGIAANACDSALGEPGPGPGPGPGLGSGPDTGPEAGPDVGYGAGGGPAGVASPDPNPEAAGPARPPGPAGRDPVDPVGAVDPVDLDAADTGVDADGPLGWRRVHGAIGLVDLEAPPELLAAELGSLRIFAGYAGWGPGQLENELSEGAWYVVESEPGDVSSPSPESLWRSVLRRQRSELALVATYPDDPSLN